MKLPNYEKANVPRSKVIDYLLSFNHPDGRSKARFFTGFGFSIESWETLAQALIYHAAEHDVIKVEASPFGTRYVIEGAISAPDGRAPHIRTIWFIEQGERIPRFVTAYPVSRREE